ncbi:MAG: gamma-glutamyltransferase [Vicinamibacterales bacterium]
MIRTAFVSLCLIATIACDRTDTPRAHPDDNTAPVARAADAASALAEGWRFAGDTEAARASQGMVVTDAPLASRVGADVLKRGGSAVDAAVATAFALAVVWPTAGNIGGGGFAVVTMNGESAALDFRETGPAAARRDMYLDAAGRLTDKSVTGHLASGIPGSVAGLWALHQKYGKTPWRDLVRPAIDLAKDGFVVDASFREQIVLEGDRLKRFDATRRLLLPDGSAPAVGSRWTNPELARTLATIQDQGTDGFYRGETARRIVTEMQKGGGIVTAADLAGYQVKWRTPLRFSYRGHSIVTMPLPSSGGLTVAMIAQQLERFDLRALGWHSADSVHLQAEAMRRAFAVRNEQFGDPDFVTVDSERIMSPQFAASLGASIALDHATPSRDVSGLTTPRVEPKHTTHFSIADAAGNAVAVTTTLNSGFGSAVTVTGGGFLLNNEMDDFAAQPGTANQFGLVQGDANAVAPGKRMLSSMTPVIVSGSDGRVRLVTGASGGPYIISTVFELISNLVDYDLPLAASVSAPRFHHQHLPDSIALEEGGFPRAMLDSLTQRKHALTFFTVPSTGWTVAATIQRTGDGWEGKADPRIHGDAAGF